MPVKFRLLWMTFVNHYYSTEIYIYIYRHARAHPHFDHFLFDFFLIAPAIRMNQQDGAYIFHGLWDAQMSKYKVLLKVHFTCRFKYVS